MIRALTLAALVATTLASASELDAGYPTPSEVAAEQVEDFSDSGVGCLDDCLDPAPFTSPDTVPDEYAIHEKEAAPK